MDEEKNHLCRRAVFPGAGLAFALAGLTLFVITGFSSHIRAEYVLSVRIFALLVVWAGAFVCCYGMQTARGCMFPLVFLLLTIPIPAGVLDHDCRRFAEGIR